MKSYFFLIIVHSEGAMGFLSRGCHMEQACLEQEPSGDGVSFPRSKKQV